MNTLIDTIAPHYCCSCGKIGRVLCSYCKYDIIEEPYLACIVCRDPVSSRESLCQRHTLPYTRAWCAGERSNVLLKLLNDYKFERVRAAHHPIVSLLDETLPQIPLDTIVVPVPTIVKHIRVRGYDHTALIAKSFAKQRGLVYKQPIIRATTTSQLGKSRRERISQAKKAFSCSALAGERYLLIDDIYTTGATLQYAAQSLVDAGAREVWVAVLARQPLEK